MITVPNDNFLISSSIAIIARAELFSNQSPIQTSAAQIAKKYPISDVLLKLESCNARTRLERQYCKYIEEQSLKRKGDFVRIILWEGEFKFGGRNWILKLNLDCTKERDTVS